MFEGAIMVPSWVALLLGLVVIPFGVGQLTMLSLLKSIKEGNDVLLRKHTREFADESGFGTIELTKSQKGILHCLKDLVHYTRYSIEERTGKPPAPRPPDASDI